MKIISILFSFLMFVSIKSHAYIHALVWNRGAFIEVPPMDGSSTPLTVSCNSLELMKNPNLYECKSHVTLIDGQDLQNAINVQQQKFDKTISVLSNELPEEIISNEKVIEKIRQIIREELAKQKVD